MIDPTTTATGGPSSDGERGALGHGRLLLCSMLLAASPVTAEMATVRVDVLGEVAHEAMEEVDYQVRPDGTVGMVVGEGAWPAPRSILLRELDAAGGETVEAVTSFVGTMRDAQLVVDSTGGPHVLVDFMAWDDGYLREVWEYVRTADGWSARLAFRSDDYNAVLAAAALGPGDSVHAAMCSGLEGRVYHATSDGGTWHWEELPHESAARYPRSVDMVVGPSGVVHMVYEVENAASDPPYRPELRYVSNAGGPWQREVIWPQGNTALSLHVHPSIGLDHDGGPVVASTYGVTAATGSLQLSRLHLSRRAGPGAWSTEVVASAADGFSAGDGPQFTGWSPALVVDGDGRLHIAFSDMACWHGETGQICQQGQIRHALLAEGSWTLRTLLRQAVNPASALHRMSIHAAGEAGGAERLYVLAHEGAPANSGWTGTWTHLRLHASESVVFSDGFERGDLARWVE